MNDRSGLSIFDDDSSNSGADEATQVFPAVEEGTGTAVAAGGIGASFPVVRRAPAPVTPRGRSSCEGGNVVRRRLRLPPELGAARWRLRRERRPCLIQRHDETSACIDEPKH